jgi:3-hydroxyacyl-CoA dehydrogenase
MRVAIVGNGQLAPQLFSLFERAGLATDLLPQLEGAVLDPLRQADWIVEASGRDVAAKRDIFALIESQRKETSLVSSDESIVPRSELAKGLGTRFDNAFAITHFFAPVDRLQLMELIVPASMHPERQQQLRLLCSGPLSRVIVDCADTPGFLANRIGLFCTVMGITEAIEAGLAVEEADAIASGYFGMPRTGLFGLADLIGLDVLAALSEALRARLPKDDIWQDYNLAAIGAVSAMLTQGRFGRATGGGFYRKLMGSRAAEPIDLRTLRYRPERTQIGAPADGELARFAQNESIAGRYARKLLARMGAYAEVVANETTTKKDALDLVIRLGFGWRDGPFALATRAGVLQNRSQVALSRSRPI